MNKLSWGKFSINFRVLLIVVMYAFFGSSFCNADTFTNTLYATTIPELNRSTDVLRYYKFKPTEQVIIEENLGTTASGLFTINGVNKDQNELNINNYSGFVISKSQTSLDISNITITGAKSAIGSAIYNTASDSNINISNSLFKSNSTLSQTDAMGGAIFAESELKLKNTSFVGNSAISQGEGEAKGGAIYATNSIEMIADSDNVMIVDNFTQTNDGTKTDNAIYIDNSSATLNISTINSGRFTIQDSIDGRNGYNVILNGDGTGRIGLFNSIYNANIFISNVIITFADGKTSNHELNNLNIGSNVGFIIDIDMANSLSDTIISPDSNGIISINELEILSAQNGNSTTLQIIKDSPNLRLNIDKLKENHVTELSSTMYNNSILADSIELGTTENTDDSIVIVGLKDVLFEMVNDTNPTHMLKNFVFKTDTEYYLTSDLSQMPQESILSIYNQSNAQYGVINANGHSMFDLVNPITVVSLKDIVIKNAHTTSNGAVVNLDNNTASFSTDNAILTKNSAEGNGGAINVKNGSVHLNNSTLSENHSDANGGAMYISGESQVEMVNINFKDNSADGKGGAIYTESNLTISAQNGASTFDGNTAGGENNAIFAGGNASITLKANDNGTIILNDKINGEEGYKLNLTGTSKGNINLNNTVENANITLSNTNLNLAKDDLLKGNEFNAKGGSINLANGNVGNTDFSKLNTSGTTKVSVDADLANKTMDRITADSYGKISGKLNIKRINLLSDSKTPKVSIKFADSQIKGHVTNSVRSTAYSRVYKYLVSYNKSNGYFTFNRGSGNDANSFNPAILTLGIAQQVAYMNQLNNYQSAMYHSDTYMMLPKKTRNSGTVKIVEDFDEITGENTFERNIIQEEIKSIWIRPYSAFENIPLKRGPKVSSINYGTLFGGDSDLIELPHGFSAVYGGYVGYNGNTTSYSNINSLQQGAVIGATGNLYKGNFFNTITANIGWQINDSDTEYGSDTMNLIMTGFADRLGYNIEIASGKVIIQPAIMMGYTFVHSSDYTTSSGVRIESDPLHVFHFAPNLRIISNLANDWQPYICVTVMCNFLDKTSYTANTIRLPEMSIEPYVEYGFGLQKRWKDKYSGFAQATVRNGGRRGVSLLFGFRYMFGKISNKLPNIKLDPKKQNAIFKPKKDAEITIAPIQNTKPAKITKASREKIAPQFNIIENLKKIPRIIFFRYNTDVSAKVVTDVYPDGVIVTSLKGMHSTKQTVVPDFKDKDLMNETSKKSVSKQDTKIKSNIQNKSDKQEKIQTINKLLHIDSFRIKNKNLYLNQNKYNEPVRAKSFKDYCLEQINLKF